MITSPKTKKSNRTIKMPKFLCEEMPEYIGMLYGLKKKDRIFTVTKSYLHHEMDRGAKAAGVKRIRIHDLRHLYVKPTTKNYFLSSNSCNSSMLSRKWHSTGERISSCFFRYLSYSPCAFSRACL